MCIRDSPSASAKPVPCLAKGTSVMLFCFGGSDGEGCPGDDSGRAGSPESLLMLTQNGDTRTRRSYSRGPAAVRLSHLDDELPVGSDVYGSGALDRDHERRRADSERSAPSSGSQQQWAGENVCRCYA